MKYVFTETALCEVAEVRDYYEAQKAGLGEDFLAALFDAIDRVCDAPEAYPQRYEGEPFRQRNLSIFPYALFFTIEPQAILFHAIFHLEREPGAWRSDA